MLRFKCLVSLVVFQVSGVFTVWATELMRCVAITQDHAAAHLGPDTGLSHSLPPSQNTNSPQHQHATSTAHVTPAKLMATSMAKPAAKSTTQPAAKSTAKPAANGKPPNPADEKDQGAAASVDESSSMPILAVTLGADDNDDNDTLSQPGGSSGSVAMAAVGVPVVSEAMRAEIMQLIWANFEVDLKESDRVMLLTLACVK